MKQNTTILKAILNIKLLQLCLPLYTVRLERQVSYPARPALTCPAALSPERTNRQLYSQLDDNPLSRQLGKALRGRPLNKSPVVKHSAHWVATIRKMRPKQAARVV